MNSPLAIGNPILIVSSSFLVFKTLKMPKATSKVTNQVNKMKTKKKKTVRPVKVVGRKALAHAPHVKTACSITNPFCIAARAAKRPDGLSQGTMPFQVRGILQVQTDAAGASMMIIVPGLGRQGYTTGTLAANVWTLGNSWGILSGSAFIATNAAEIRIVSMGVIFRSTASMTNCSGLLHKAIVTSPTVSQVFSQMNQNNVEDELTPLTSGFESTWISKPLGSRAHSFRPYADVTSTMSDFDWTSCYFEVLGGAPNTIIGSVEYVVNVEIQLNSTGITTTGLSGAVLATKPANPVALQAQNAIHSSIPSFIQGGVAKAETVITNAASKAVSNLLDMAEDFGLGLLGL